MDEEAEARRLNGAADMALRLAALALLAAWCFVLLRPFIATLLWGAILAVALRPVHEGLAHALGGRAGLAAGLISAAGLALIIGPVSLLATSFVSGFEALAAAFKSGRLTAPPPPARLAELPFIGERLFGLWTLAAENLVKASNLIAPAAGEIAGRALAAAGAAGLTVLQFAAAFVIAGLLLPRAMAAEAGLTRLADRLAPARGAAFVSLAAHTVRNVARGVIGVALLQGLLMGAAMLAAGIPFAGVWAFLCVALAIVQIGAGPVALGTILYAWGALDPLAAGLFTVWMVVASLIDNVLKPVLMARGLSTPMPVILLGLLGGTLAHGLIGLFVGPVVLAVGYDLMRVWMESAPTDRPG